MSLVGPSEETSVFKRLSKLHIRPRGLPAGGPIGAPRGHLRMPYCSGSGADGSTGTTIVVGSSLPHISQKLDFLNIMFKHLRHR